MWSVLFEMFSSLPLGEALIPYPFRPLPRHEGTSIEDNLIPRPSFSAAGRSDRCSSWIATVFFANSPSFFKVRAFSLTVLDRVFFSSSPPEMDDVSSEHGEPSSPFFPLPLQVHGCGSLAKALLFPGPGALRQLIIWGGDGDRTGDPPPPVLKYQHFLFPLSLFFLLVVLAAALQREPSFPFFSLSNFFFSVIGRTELFLHSAPGGFSFFLFFREQDAVAAPPPFPSAGPDFFLLPASS